MCGIITGSINWKPLKTNTMFTEREQIIEVVNRLFVYTDAQNWEGLLVEVFAEDVTFDMSSMGAGPATTIPAKDICKMWEAGFKGLDAVHHQAGNYLVTVNQDEATVFAYAIAFHYKKAATAGNTRSFTGSYDLHLVKSSEGWRIDSFKYNLKIADGNVDFK